MNICVVSIVTYWHGLKGGMDLHGKALLEGLCAKGHKIVVISTRHPSGRVYEEINGIRIHYLDRTTFGSSRKGWPKQSAEKFKQIANKEKIDIVVSQSSAGYSICKTARNMAIPFVTIMHGYETMIARSVLNQVLNFRRGYFYFIKSFLASIYYSIFQELPILLNSSLIIATSNTVAEVLGNRAFVNRRKIVAINYGLDLSLFKYRPEERKRIREKLNISDHERVILFLSLLSRQKGTDIAIKAFNELADNKNLRLIVAGDGEYLEEAKLLTKQFHIESRVIFPGFIPNEDTTGYYNAADIFVFPTLRVESFGIVIAEAMACGKPVIASNIGSIPELIDNGINGILVPPGDFVELSRQINRVLNDQEYMTSLAENARQKALKRFSLNRMLEDTIQVFESAIPRGQD